MMKQNKITLLIDVILIVGLISSIAGVWWYSSDRGIQFSPNELNNVLFSFNSDSRAFIEGDGISGLREIKVIEGELIRLDAGNYKWIIDYGSTKYVHELTIENEVILMLKKNDGQFDVVSIGGELLDVEVYSGDNLKNKFVLAGGGI